MLEIDPIARIGATKALSHPYFFGLDVPKSPDEYDESNVEDCDDEHEIANNIINFQKKYSRYFISQTLLISIEQKLQNEREKHEAISNWEHRYAAEVHDGRDQLSRDEGEG